VHPLAVDQVLTDLLDVQGGQSLLSSVLVVLHNHTPSAPTLFLPFLICEHANLVWNIYASAQSGVRHFSYLEVCLMTYSSSLDCNDYRPEQGRLLLTARRIGYRRHPTPIVNAVERCNRRRTRRARPHTALRHMWSTGPAPPRWRSAPRLPGRRRASRWGDPNRNVRTRTRLRSRARTNPPMSWT